MGRKRKQAQQEGGSWLVTFSDLMTLLMLFFILLYSMETSEGTQQEAIINSIQNAFSGGSGILSGGGVIDLPGSVEVESEWGIDISELDLDEFDLDDVLVPEVNNVTLRETLEQMIRWYLANQGMSSEVSVEYIEEGILLQLQDYILFESASASLKLESIDILNRLGTLLSQFEGDIHIVGHTDNIPIGTVQFPSNWELGLARATAIVKYYERQGFSGSRFIPSTHGDTRPIATNDTSEGRALNRRVNFLIEATPEDVTRLQTLLQEYEEH